MEDQKNTRGWWKTVPGIITTVAGLISAVAALIVGLNQLGVFHSSLSMTDAFKQNKYEFGWSGDTLGRADSRIEYYSVGSIRFTEGNVAVLGYSRPGGGEVRATLGDHKLIGTWRDSDGQGEIELLFDEAYSRGVGWWNRGGQMQKYNAFMRRAK